MMFNSRKIAPPPRSQSFIRKALDILGKSIFPKTCFECAKYGRYLCEKCMTNLRDPDVFYPSGADFALVSFSYKTPAIKKVLRQLKYHSASDVALELAEIVAEDLSPYLKFGVKPTICEIPMTAKRRRQRGFNQAELLARHLAEILDLAYQPLLVKTRETKPQVEIKNRKDRLKNMRGVFALKTGAVVPRFALVVDDIITTSATMSEAARALKKAGVKKIICAAVAR